MPKKNPALSIITINYNNASKLEKTILSVVNQSNITPSEVEYIIIDGGSTDGSKEIIEKYAKSRKYSKFISYWCSEPDAGIYNAMNKGLKKATGSLIGLINSGDFYLPNTLSDIIDIHKKNKECVLYGALKVFKDNEFQDIWGRNACTIPNCMIPHPSTFVPKAIYDKYGVFDESFKIAADYDLFSRLYTNKVCFLFVDKIISGYNLEGISATNGALTEKEVIIVKKRYGFYKEPTARQKFIKFLKSCYHFFDKK